MSIRTTKAGNFKVVESDGRVKATIGYDRNQVRLTWIEEAPDIEVIPRGMYLTEVLGGECGFFLFNINGKADPKGKAYELAQAVDL